MVIYLDVLIMENFIVNYFLLYITSQTLKIKVKFWRLMVSSLLGAAYVLTKVYPSLFLFSTLIFKLLMALIMVILLFSKRDIVLNLKAFFIYMMYSMLLAGICIFIEFNQQNDNFSSSIYNFSYKKLMIAIIIIYLTLDRLVIYIKDRKSLKSLIFTVDIISKNCEKKILAFLDTGNELREPATNLPVMIIEKNYFKDFSICEKDIFYIPYKVVDGTQGKLKGFKPEYINIYDGKEIKRREVIIALSETKLSNLNDYHALLSRGVI